jgi:DNA polymerase I-like protein with 3'-5' exonuclease and polymerase domains
MNWLSLDTETTGIDLWHGCKPYAVTMAWQRGDDLVQRPWVWDVNPLTRGPIIPPREIAQIREMIATHDLVFHNIKYDVRALEVAGILEWKYTGKLPGGNLKGITVPEILERSHDTLIAAHVINSLESHGLKDLAVKYLDELPTDEEDLKEAVIEARRLAKGMEWNLARDRHPHWPAINLKSGKAAKNENGSEEKSTWKADMWVPRAVARKLKYPKDHPWWTILKTYALKDVERTLGLWLIGSVPKWASSGFLSYLEDENLMEQYRIRMRQVSITYRMERNGLPIDPTELESAITSFTERRDVCRLRLMNHVRKSGIDPETFNPGSDTQLGKFLYEKLRLPVLGLTPGGKPSTKAEYLDALAADLEPNSKGHIVIHSLLGMRKSQKMLDYLEGYKLGALPDGDFLIIRPNIIITGTKTTRFSGEDPNPQNVSKKDRPKHVYKWINNRVLWVETTEGDIAYNLRIVFKPAPGWVLYDLDYDNGELRLFAYDSGDERLIDAFKTGGSMHLVIARELWREELPEDDEKAKKTDMYRWTKNGNFSLIYGASKAKADATYHIPGAYDLLRERMPLIDAYIQEMHGIVRTDGYVNTLGGDLGYPLRVPKSEPHKASNYRIQGSLGWIMNNAMVACDDYLRKINKGDWDEPNGRMLLQVHDSLIFAFPEDSDHVKHAEHCAKLMSEAATMILKRSGMDMDALPNPPIPTSIDQIAPGESWAAGKAVKDGKVVEKKPEPKKETKPVSAKPKPQPESGPKPKLKRYTIWQEGYLATGMEGMPARATIVAENVIGATFKDACINYAKQNPEWARDFNPEWMTHWGCGLFAKEADARKLFG